MDLDKTPDHRKRLLSIDGGGIRGIISAKILEKMETMICSQGNPQWTCLGDYFDFIGGTSTGAIIAAGLANKMKMQDILDLYVNKGEEIFKERCCVWLGTKYNPKTLERELQKIFGEMTLGKIQKPKLMIVSKNATEGNPWFFVNHKQNKYYEVNKNLKLRDLIRASSAAPTYFPPQLLQVNPFGSQTPEKQEFIDGAMSMFNNPAFQLFLEATHEGYGIQWELGKNNLLLVSVGTGFTSQKLKKGQAEGFWKIGWAQYAIDSLMNDAKIQQHILLQLMSGQLNQKYIEYESSELDSFLQFDSFAENVSYMSNNLEFLTYRRYSIPLTKPSFQTLGVEDIDPKSVTPIDCVKQIKALERIGKAVADKLDLEKDFQGFM